MTIDGHPNPPPPPVAAPRREIVTDAIRFLFAGIVTRFFAPGMLLPFHAD